MKQLRFTAVMLMGVMVLLTFPLYSATSRELQVQGFVPDPQSLLGVEVVPDEDADNLDLLIRESQRVALVSVRSQSSGSYKIRVTSLNQFHLCQSGQNEFRIPYRLIIRDIDGNQAQRVFQPNQDGDYFAEEITQDTDWDVEVIIQQTPDSDFPGGYYQDVLTFEVQAT
jgi:hypothetical protein